MMLRNWRWTAASFYLLVACGSSATLPASDTPTTTGTAGTTPASGVASASGGTAVVPVTVDAGQTQLAAGSGGTTAVIPVNNEEDASFPARPASGAGGTSSPTSATCDYEKQAVALAQTLVVPAGKTVHVCSGVTFTAASADVKIDVLGTLIVDGTADAKVSFLGSGMPRSWYGVVIEKGGNVKLTHAMIGGAAYGLYALPGSSFAIDYTEFNTSFKAAIIQSNGTINHSKFEATSPPTISLASDVSVDDPNGTLTIMDASPMVSNCNFDGSSSFTDMVRVGGQSSPTFDHVYLHGAHCGFHTSGGTNTTMHVTNALFENLAYAVMAYATKPDIENSVFHQNSTDVGECTGATKDNTPTLKNNSYTNGSPVIDASCFMIGTTDASPAATANPSAGPSGL